MFSKDSVNMSHKLFLWYFWIKYKAIRNIVNQYSVIEINAIQFLIMSVSGGPAINFQQN